MGRFLYACIVIYDMGIDEFKTQSGSVSNRDMRDVGDVKAAVAESDADIVDTESRSGSFSCLCVCKHCGDKFWKGVSRIERGDGSYCSIECSAQGRKGQVISDLNTTDDIVCYIAGLVFGDGHLRYIEETGNYNVIFVNTSIELIDSFKRSVDSIGGSVSVRVTETKDSLHSDCYYAKVSSVKLYNHINDNIYTPEDVLMYCTTDSQKLLFVRGFYEAEGSVQDYRARISQADKDILCIVSKFISDTTGIECDIRKHGGQYYNLVVEGKDDVSAFVEAVDPTIKGDC